MGRTLHAIGPESSGTKVHRKNGARVRLLTPDSSQNGGDLSDSSFTDVEGEGDEDDDDQNDEASGFSDGESGIVKVPLRNARRKSVMPKSAPVIKVNDIEYLDVPDHSPGNSITSINSIASLLKEKLALTLPAVVKKPPKRSNEYKLHAFVGLLFLCIVFLVGFAYVFYHQQVLQRAYFPKIRFNNKDRVVRIYNEKDNEVLVGFLGQDLGHDTAFACLPRDQIQEAACMEWMHKARLYMSYKEYEGSKCYRIIWTSLSEDLAPTDCYDWTSEYGHWYGGGQTPNMQWPVERGEIKMAPFITGDTSKHQWGNVVKRYFINSNGVVLFVDPSTPLYISINETYSKKFCLQAKHDNFSYVYHRPLPTLNYTICTSENITSLHQSRIYDRPVSTLSLKDREMIDKLMTEPIWHIIPSNSSELTEKNIFNYSEDVLKYKFLKHGHILINEFWQENIGDFVLDNSRFPKMNDTIDILHRRGFRIIFSIQPFISTEAVTFKEAVRNELLVSQRGPDHYIPSLTRYKSVLSAGVIDITKKVTIPWLQNKLKPLMDNYAVDCFYVDIGSAYDLPFYYEFEDALANPDEYKTVFMDSMSSKIDIVGVSSAITRPNGPVFVSLPPYPSTWESLQSVIASVLTYGIIGFPLVMPGPIGGSNITKMFKTTDNETEKMDETLPDKELYMRWLQLSAFLPAMSFSYLPQKYGDEKVINLAESISNLRETLVNPIVKEYLKAYGPLDEGLPFNRPLWMLDPKDPICHTIVDEFSVGEELIVAPVITKDAREREIYLPAGVWRDGIDGSLMKGSRWLHHHPVEEDKIAYFVRMPDDTRF
ncbi:hypothetical protein R5R35_007157 [Gryllus longicercus]|uniref:Myogenesis-regulating glycosidase n=1 Tax=Gryllus longicercus TaxID=2509291 RepID=A0AAN9V3R9_9ORTH